MARFERKSLRAETRREIQRMAVEPGICTPAEADEAATFMDQLADREMSGELTPAEAKQKLVAFSLAQLRKRAN
jgi:hypothetical protein